MTGDRPMAHKTEISPMFAPLKYSLAELAREVRRVFGPAEVSYELGNDCSVLVEGWPSRQYYDANKLGDALRGFADDHGTTEAGDADVCRALEICGTHLADHGYAPDA